MANICNYNMVVVSPNKENLERLIKIMNYKDEEYFIYRCFSVSENEINKEDNLYTVNLQGDVAWTVSRWFEWNENKNEKVIIGRDENNETIYGNAHYITLDILCERLNLGIEIFAEESGCCFQEHYMINHNGECTCNESAEWIEHWVDEDGNDLDEPYEEGGLDNYNDFSTPEEIYG